MSSRISLRSLSAASAAFVLALCTPVLVGADTAPAPTPSPKGASERIISPVDGATVTSPVRVVFGLTGMGVAPAGVVKDGTGHHHLLIDAPLPDLHFAVPKDEHHLHFGGGQTETTIELPPGKHTLQLLLADANHVPHSPPIYSKRITIHVK